MRQVSPVAVAVVGSGFIAITYGLARFVFGLFLPMIRADMAVGPVASGIIGALPFVSFVLATLVAPRVVRSVGVRRAAVGTSSLSLTGLLIIAQAPGPLVLALGVLTCGLSTGLALPVMAEAVHLTVRHGLRGRISAIINAGTSVGIAASVPAVLWWGAAWRPAYEGFAVIAALGLVAVLIWLPVQRGHGQKAWPRPPDPATRQRQWLSIARLGGLAGAMGFVSALYWVFAPDFAVTGGGLPPGQTAWMWLAVGIGGLAGSGAGDLIDHYGSGISHAFALAVLSASLTLLAADPGHLPLAMVSAAAFGAAYMTLTGFYLVEGTRIMADRPAFGPVIPVIAVACGQIAGSPVGGWVISSTGYGTAFGVFAAFALGVAMLSLWLAAATVAAGADTPVGEE